MRTCAAAAILAVISAAVSYGDTLVRRIGFDPVTPDFSLVNGWAVFEPEGFELKAPPGAPLLPAVPVVFLLPGGVEDVAVESRILEKVELVPRGLRLLPASVARPVGCADSVIPVEDPEIYSMSSPWPGDPVISFHHGNLAGVSVVSCLVQPWEYVPATGFLAMVTEMELQVSWSPTSGTELTPAQAEIAMVRASRLAGVDYPASKDLPRGGDSEYLLICDSAYVDELDPLAALHEEKGLSVEIATVRDILSSFPGGDDAEKLRNFIKDRYLNHGTIFVLLAGDETLVPVRMVDLYCEGYADTAPVDLYFADLDGTWDGDGDGKYGQPGDNLDLYADVLLGRALFSTEEEAEVFVAKNLAYQQSPTPGDWRNKAVLCGAVLFEEIGYTSDKGCDSIAAAFPLYWKVHKFYEKLPGGGFTEHISAIRRGSAWNHYAGHGTNTGVWWSKPPLAMMTTRIAGDTLDNGNKVGIHTSIACHPGNYPNHASCAEGLLHNPDGGGVAVMFNVSYGWEGHWPSLGPSEWMCIDLARQVFRYQAHSLGQAFSTARDLRVPYIAGDYDRTFQSLLSFSAFMDPALKVMRTVMAVPIPPVPFSMSAPFPNPAREGAPVSFMLGFEGHGAHVSVHDLSGRLLWETHVNAPGIVTWDTVEGSLPVTSGVYLITAEKDGRILGRMVTVLD